MASPVDEVPMVSIFLPYYNDEAFLKEAVEAVLAQSFGNWELFLLNHASTDSSRSIARSFADERIRHVDAAQNLGAGSGVNLQKVLPLMRGKYVKLLCADDVLKPNALELLVACLEQDGEADFVCSDMDYMDKEGKSLNTKWSIVNRQWEFPCDAEASLRKLFYSYSHVAYPTVLLRRSVFDKVRPDASLVMLFDVSLWVQALAAGCRMRVLQEALVWYRISPTQLSSAENQEEAMRILRYENHLLMPLWFRLADVRMVQALFPSAYSTALQVGDERFIPFVVAHFLATAYFKKQGGYRKLCGIMKLHELMEDAAMRSAIEEKFGFTIRDFRDIYRRPARKLSRKEKLMETPAMDLTTGQLLHLLFRRWFHVLVSPFKKRHKM